MATTGAAVFTIRHDLAAFGKRLLHRQCWLWGQDIRRPEGNLLLALGFERERPPEGVTGSTQYSLRLDARLVVRLWGFGFAYGTEDEQIYMNRYDFRPRLLCRDANRWEPPTERLPFAPDSILLEAAARWIASYEMRIAEQAGQRYRSRLVLQWKERQKNERSIAGSWSRLADDLGATRYRRSP